MPSYFFTFDDDASDAQIQEAKDHAFEVLEKAGVAKDKVTIKDRTLIKGFTLEAPNDIVSTFSVQELKHDNVKDIEAADGAVSIQGA